MIYRIAEARNDVLECPSPDLTAAMGVFAAAIRVVRPRKGKYMLEQAPAPERGTEESFTLAVTALEEHFRPDNIGYLLAVARRRLGDERFVEDVVLDSYVELLARVDAFHTGGDADKVAAAAVDYASRAYLAKVVARKAIDRVRKLGRETGTDDFTALEAARVAPETEPEAGDLEVVHQDPGAEVARRQLDELARTGLGAILLALWNRTPRHGRTVLTLSDADMEHLALFYRFLPTLEPRDSTHDPDRGMNERLAERYGVDKATASRRTARITNTAGLALYLTCVLGHAGHRPTPETVETHFDAFDSMSGDPERGADVLRLRLAGRALRDHPGKGVRVDLPLFAAEVAKEQLAQQKRAARRGTPALDASVDVDSLTEALHAAESRYATYVRNPHPACVTVCSEHNPETHRPLEF